MIGTRDSVRVCVVLPLVALWIYWWCKLEQQGGHLERQRYKWMILDWQENDPDGQKKGNERSVKEDQDSYGVVQC